MPRTRKAYLPPVVAWFTVAIILAVWLLVTWIAFATPEGQRELGVVGWLLVTVMEGLIVALLYLMAKRKIPAYILEDDED